MRNSSFFLNDMREALTRMIEVTDSIKKLEFSQNWVVIPAVRDQIMILGEAAKQVSPEICEKYPEIPWSQLAKTRDRHIHGYFKTDPDLLYVMATVRAEILLSTLIQIISDMKDTFPETEDY